MQQTPQSLILVAFVLTIGIAADLAVARQSGSGRDRDRIEFFEKRIRPVLVEHCYECHAAGADQLQGSLLVDSRQGLRDGGDSGPALIEGKPDESLLLEALRYESFEMPPSGKLPDHIINDFETWVRDGAVDPRNQASESKTRQVNLKDHWAFQPLTKAQPPPVADSSWPRTDIDRFILARLEENQIQTSNPADETTLVRRLYFDLIGLPPSPTEIDEFLNDRSPDKIALLVDRLLGSNHFGERWGRHWLDVARYSDSSGGGRLLIFQDAWRYRDYVIDAFNDDTPINQFIRQQVAGDLLPYGDYLERRENLTATGFLMLGPHNYELQDKELLRMEVVDEQIDVSGRAILGLTLGCARCHDHKFDPIPTTDYYALAGIFRSTRSLEPGNVSRFVETELPLEPVAQQRLDQARADLAKLEQRLKKIADQQTQLQSELKALGPIDAASLRGIVIDDEQAELVGKWQASDSVTPFVGTGYRYASDPNSKAVFELSIEKDGRYQLLASHTPHPNRSAKVPIKVLVAGDSSEYHVNQKLNPKTNGLFNLLGSWDLKASQPVRVEISPGAGGATIIDAVQLVPMDGQSEPGTVSTAKLSDKRERILSELQPLEQQQLQLKSEIAQAKKQIEQPGQVMSVREEAQTEDYFVCIRGNVHQLGDSVGRRALAALPLTPTLSIPSGASGRLELADWMVDPKNPLTARVFVNRVWSKLLGHGLVRTPDNFGVMGSAPTHPELLDYLARAFQQHQWSTKWLIREIVTSQVYQLSSTRTGAGVDVDPENFLLSRAHRRRLDAEAIRDSLLSFSGELDLRPRGPSVGKEVKSEFGYEYKTKRRSIYLPIFRNTLHDLLDVFDFPNPNLVAGKRNESTLPTQALYLMNSPFVLEQSQAAAAQFSADLDKTLIERVDLAFRRALGRYPSVPERQSVIGFLNGELQRGTPALTAWTDFCQTLVSSLDFRYLD